MPHCTERKQSMDTGLACLVTVARLYGLPADPQQLRHSHSESGKTFDERTIILAGKELGLKIRALNSHWKRLHKTPLPAIAQHRDGRWFIIAGFKDDRVLIQDPLAEFLCSQFEKDVPCPFGNGSITVGRRDGSWLSPTGSGPTFDEGILVHDDFGQISE